MHRRNVSPPAEISRQSEARRALALSLKEPCPRQQAPKVCTVCVGLLRRCHAYIVALDPISIATKHIWFTLMGQVNTGKWGRY